MHAALVEAADEADELCGVLEGVVLAVVVLAVARRIAAQREDVADSGLRRTWARMSSISCSLWQTQVRCGMGSSVVVCLRRTTRSWVSWRVDPPAP
jgi:hypothetical protein